MSDRATVDFLATVALLEGQEETDLVELARVMRLRTVREGETIWRQGDHPREMLFVVDGAVSASLDVTGDRAVDIGHAGPGDTVGEIAMLDGDGHTMSARATETATVLALSRPDFLAMLAGRHRSALRLTRSLVALLTARLGNQLGHLAVSLGSEMADPGAPGPTAGFADLERCGPPDSRYVRRMATFHDVDPLALWGLLTSGTYVRCPPGRTLVAEGEPSTAYHLTINGAVERVLIRGTRRIRVGLAGPGRAFGYEGLIDGLPSPVTAIARERALLLELPPDPFGRLFGAEDGIARVFLDVIQRDIMVSMRQTLPALARGPGARPAAPDG